MIHEFDPIIYPRKMNLMGIFLKTIKSRQDVVLLLKPLNTTLHVRSLRR